MRGRARVIIGVAMMITIAAPVDRSSAYTASGDRIFPATPILPQLTPGDEFYVNLMTLPLASNGPGTPNRSTNLTVTYIKSITDRLGIEVEETHTFLGRSGGAGSLSGWQNFDAELKYLAVNDTEHEFLVSLGVDRESGGTGTLRVGASPSGATTPRLYFGKGFGDLDIGYLRPLAVTGLGGVQIADFAPRPNLVTGGFVVEYSIPYLESKVQSFNLPEVIRSLTPMTEISFTTPAGRSYGARMTALIAPGVSCAGEGWEFAIEALVPASRATGTGFGVTAQIHFALDFLFADTIGKPIFSVP
jgi:hypothetical protein